MDELFIREIQIDWNRVDSNSYLNKIRALKGLDRLTLSSNITFLVGENGSGKSTLLEAIAVSYGFNAEGGTQNYSFSTYQDVSSLSNAMTLVKGIRRAKIGYFFRAETFFNVATASINKYHGADYHSSSHGESFMSFMQGFDQTGLYLMDEPEAALSPQRQLTLLKHIYAMAQSGSQFIIATHSPIILGCPEAEILSFDTNGIKPCEYESTESYKITKLFLNRREQMIKELLDD